MISVQPIDTFSKRLNSYENTADCNDSIHQEFSRLTDDITFLKEHRQHIEANELGFGDTAFHYMWYLIMQYLNQNFDAPSLLEIGVFKGQVISLWSLIASKLRLKCSITGITPLEGHPLPKSFWNRLLKTFTSKRFREESAAGNFYAHENYRLLIEDLFNYFDLDLSETKLIKGFSNDVHVLETVKDERFSLIYIDGDHTFEGVTSDIKNYSSKLEVNGLLVMDDASCYIPGTAFWKGHPSVSKACEILPYLGFKNILNVGHNRIYKRQ